MFVAGYGGGGTDAVGLLVRTVRCGVGMTVKGEGDWKRRME